MPDVLGSPPSPRTALFWNGTAWQWALVDAAGNLQIDVLSTVMDAAAATAANQALMVTALQLIDNLVVALGGPGNVRLQVRAEDQLFSFKSRYSERPFTTNSNAGVHDLYGTAVEAGQVWIVTAVGGMNQSHGCDVIQVGGLINAQECLFNSRASVVVDEVVPCGHTMVLVEGDKVMVRFTGCTAGDTLLVGIDGYKMTLEV